MAWYWNPYAVPGLLALVFGCSLAVTVYATNPGRLQNRSLSLYLVCLTAAIGCGTGLMLSNDDPRTALGFQAVAFAGLFAALPIYLVFLSTLPTPWVAWLRRRWVRAVLLVSPLLIMPLSVLAFDSLVARVAPAPHARIDAAFTDLGTRAFELDALVTATLGIVAAIGALRAAQDKAGRARARWYAIAFVFWEVCQLVAFVMLEIAFKSASASPGVFTAAVMIFASSFVVFILLLTYAILHAQLFDIDLKLKFALGKGTLGAAFLAVFFVVSQLVQVLAGAAFGAVAGAIAAGLLLFALRPLERLAHGVAEKAMPKTQDTPLYAQFRKMEVYKAAVESFHLDGRVTSRERDALSRLAAKLGIAATDARAIETDLHG
ncbi:MAG TPA: hypothetical protein VM327_02210 [Candidatus Thermoplasmatota archaeon]|nr:hypothetical protein [Candidatus Thermoplasmatota archaeon]